MFYTPHNKCYTISKYPYHIRNIQWILHTQKNSVYKKAFLINPKRLYSFVLISILEFIHKCLRIYNFCFCGWTSKFFLSSKCLNQKNYGLKWHTYNILLFKVSDTSASFWQVISIRKKKNVIKTSSSIRLIITVSRNSQAVAIELLNSVICNNIFEYLLQNTYTIYKEVSSNF